MEATGETATTTTTTTSTTGSSKSTTAGRLEDIHELPQPQIPSAAIAPLTTTKPSLVINTSSRNSNSDNVGTGTSSSGASLTVHTPSTPRIDISRASSSSHHDSRDSSPENVFEQVS